MRGGLAGGQSDPRAPQVPLGGPENVMARALKTITEL